MSQASVIALPSRGGDSTGQVRCKTYTETWAVATWKPRDMEVKLKVEVGALSRQESWRRGKGRAAGALPRVPLVPLSPPAGPGDGSLYAAFTSSTLLVLLCSRRVFSGAVGNLLSLLCRAAQKGQRFQTFGSWESVDTSPQCCPAWPSAGVTHLLAFLASHLTFPLPHCASWNLFQTKLPSSHLTIFWGIGIETVALEGRSRNGKSTSGAEKLWTLAQGQPDEGLLPPE